MTSADKQATIECFGIRGMTVEHLEQLIADHKSENSYASNVIVQVAREELFIKRAIGAC